jgi:hypothetical protein
MKLPISIVEKNGDVTVHASVNEAEMDMEPMDVEAGEYVVTDANGRRLRVEVVLEEVPLFWGLWKTRVKKVRIAEPSWRCINQLFGSKQVTPNLPR